MHKSVISVITSLLFSAAFLGQSFLPVSAYSADNFDARLKEPNKNAESEEYRYYYSTDNVFVAIGYGMPNCTAYAWGRTYELSGIIPDLSTGNAGRWYTENIAKGVYAYGSEPKLGAIGCYDRYNNIDGHVTVVEGISPDRSEITVSESQYGAVNFITYTYKSDSSNHMSKYRFLGYIYPDDQSGKFYGDAYKISSASNGFYITYSENLSASLNTALNNTVLQNFRFEPQENGTYKIWSLSEDIVLRHDNGNVTLGYDNGTSSEWKLYSDGSSEYYISPADDNTSAIAVSGRALTLSDISSDRSVKWNIERVTGITPLNITELPSVQIKPDNNREETTDPEPEPAPNLNQTPDTTPAPVGNEDSVQKNDEYESKYLSVDWSAMKTDYSINEIPDISGITLMINERKIQKIDISKLEINYDFSIAGNAIVEVIYDGLTAYYPVTVFDDSQKDSLTEDITQYLLSGYTAAAIDLDIDNDSMITVADLVASVS